MYIYLYIYRYMYILFFVDGCVILFDELYLWQELGAINLCWLSDRAKSLWGLADNNTKVLIYMFSPCRITLVDEQSGQRFNFSRSGPSTMTFPVDDIFRWLEEEWGVNVCARKSKEVKAGFFLWRFHVLLITMFYMSMLIPTTESLNALKVLILCRL